MVFEYLMGLDDIVRASLPRTPSGKTRLYRREDLHSIRHLVQSLGGTAPLKKIIPEEDIDFIFSGQAT